MNRQAVVSAGILGLILSGGGVGNARAAAAPPAPAPVESVEATHEALRALRDGFVEALNKGDLETMGSYLHEDVVFTTMNMDVRRGRQAVRDYYTTMMKGPARRVESVSVSVSVDDLTILHGGDTGISYGGSRDQYRLADGSEFEIGGRWSCTLVKEGGKWLLASIHYSTNVFDNPVLDKLKRWSVLLAAGLALAGLAGGALLGRFCCRAKAA